MRVRKAKLAPCSSASASNALKFFNQPGGFIFFTVPRALISGDFFVGCLNNAEMGFLDDNCQPL